MNSYHLILNEVIFDKIMHEPDWSQSVSLLAVWKGKTQKQEKACQFAENDI